MALNKMISTFIGLGNIGDKYAGTRHNLGSEVLNRLSQKWKIKPSPGSGDFYIAEKDIDGIDIRLIWPTTYMNNSGSAVKQILEKYELTPDSMMILCDDINLPLGKIRIRSGGSDGGHNGLGSIIYHLKTEKFPRLRMGVGPLPENTDQTGFVLGRFAENEIEIMKKMLVKSEEIILYLLKSRLEEAMSVYNINPAPDKAQ
ncbi:MAG: aminoacyl-tRNA hydrolase [Candidatus Zixiibacteriota bacterium]|nr:MAG: aminoacyl-tRNA hydrolase [candidate division Zixibacteria bacterium]